MSHTIRRDIDDIALLYKNVVHACVDIVKQLSTRALPDLIFVTKEWEQKLKQEINKSKPCSDYNMQLVLPHGTLQIQTDAFVPDNVAFLVKSDYGLVGIIVGCTQQ